MGKAKAKPKRGRPIIEIDDKQLIALMRLKPTIEDTAAFFDCNEDTIRRHIRKHHGKDFATFRDQKAVHTRHALVRACIEKALKGDNTMLIWCTKNLCGWTDRQDTTADVTVKEFKLNYARKKEPKE
jgi:hypothetical protein